jgi:murein DD-endopeptidase MepM/ murein hydrolase activator NlpD
MAWLASATAVVGLAAQAQLFQLPTANRALFEPGGEERFFVGTVGKPWITGTFGCVRSDGGQMHEGLDIRCLQRDRRGEPTDPVLATADGTVAYYNSKPALSTYGVYVVLRHAVQGLEVYSLYAHLSRVQPGLKIGQPVKVGEILGTLGRTANTAQSISRERAHVHFELDLLVNERFPAWYKREFPDQRNDHGVWNGQNFLGLDPREIFLLQARLHTNFSLVTYLRSRPVLCRVLVRDVRFPWLRRYAALVERPPVAPAQAPAGYELHLNYNGVPVRLIPRHAAEMAGPGRFQLLAVNEAELRQHPCRRLVVKRGDRWELGRRGQQLLELLTF